MHFERSQYACLHLSLSKNKEMELEKLLSRRESYGLHSSDASKTTTESPQPNTSELRFSINTQQENAELAWALRTGDLSNTEVLLNVLLFLDNDGPALLRLRLVCKRWRFYVRWMPQWSAILDCQVTAYRDHLKNDTTWGFSVQSPNGRYESRSSTRLPTTKHEFTFPAMLERKDILPSSAYLMLLQRSLNSRTQGRVPFRSSLFGCLENKQVCLEVALCATCHHLQIFHFGEPEEGRTFFSRFNEPSSDRLSALGVSVCLLCSPWWAHPCSVARMYRHESENCWAAMCCPLCYMCRDIREFGWMDRRKYSEVESWSSGDGTSTHRYLLAAPQVWKATVEQPVLMM